MAQELPPVNPAVLRWAVGESGFSVDDIADRIGVARDVLAGWLAGHDGPTHSQLTRLAELVKRPASLFFLGSPPPVELPPNLRRAVGRTERNLDAAELQQVRRARRTQRLIRFLLIDQGASRVAMPNIDPGVGAASAGSDIRRWIGVTLGEQLGWQSQREAFSSWRAQIEVQGVLVMQLRLGGGGLRGFSLFDEFAPLAAVNTAENLQARTFTLMHETAHLVSRTGTACLAGVTPSSESTVERWCDRVASAVLMPRDALASEFQKLSPSEEATVEAVRTIAARFHASLRATALGLIQAGLADPDLYAAVTEEFPTGDYDKGFGRGGGLRAPQQRLNEVGPLAASLVVEALAHDRLSEREARQYLRLDGTELSELAVALGGRA